MKTVVISGASRPPPELADIIARGSTSVVTRDTSDIASVAALAGVADRIVFWRAGGDARVKSLAAQCASDRSCLPADAIVFVTEDAADVPAGFTPDELFLWPKDEDRLKMAFMTGA